MEPRHGIQLTDETLRQIVNKKMELPFTVLNYDIANEPRLHKIGCTYVEGWIKPDSKKENRTGSHWLVLENEAPTDATKNCNGKGCWRTK
jgi:hypothetical protein